ncbi:MAG: CopL family metal-binding regulatory protein [Colwellia sp.]|nr:CopL family metal-binding regulatory protein [Colwellia sp.]
MVLLLCLIFVGQTIASTIMPYHVMNMSGMMDMENSSAQEQSHDMAALAYHDHNTPSNSTLTHSEESIEDCCVTSCDCATSGCSNIAALTKNVSSNLSVVLSSKITFVSNSAHSQQLTSLYRPPILS